MPQFKGLFRFFAKLHGRRGPATEGRGLPDEEGAGLFRHGPGEPPETLPGHPWRVRRARTDCTGHLPGWSGFYPG